MSSSAILDAQLAALVDDLGAALVAELLAHGLQFGHDELHHQRVVRENSAQPLDRLHQLEQLVEYLLPLEAGQALELHVEDRLRLQLRQPELHHQPLARFGRALRSPNQLDYFVEMIERDLEAFEDVGPRLRLAQLELRAAADDLPPELDEVLDDLEDVEHLRPAAGDRQHDDAERRLQRRVLVEVVQDDVGHLAALQFDDDPHAVPIGFVTEIADPLDRLLTRELGDLLDQPRLVDLVGDLRDDDRLFVPLLALLDRRARAHRDRPASRRVGLVDARAADDEPAGRKVGAAHRANHRLEPRVLRLAALIDGGDDAVDHLAQVVRRDVRRHPDGDARRAVHEQVGKRRRKDGRLLSRLVVVGDEVDRLTVEVRHHRLGHRLGTRFRVTHRRGRIAVDRSEVPLPVDQGIAHVEFLREADEGVVDRGVAVGMVVPHDLADDLRALAVGAVGREPHRAHAVQHATVRGLEPVARVGQRSADDHAHRVIHV